MPMTLGGGAGSIASSNIIDDEIVNADINSAAAIARTKMAADAWIFKSVLATRNTGDASGAVTYAHGLGRVPERVRLSAYGTYNGIEIMISQGVFDESGNHCISFISDYTTPVRVSSTYAIIISRYSDGALGENAGVVSVDATNITITWTLVGAKSLVVNFLMEVE
jgi:hypothetical protein